MVKTEKTNKTRMSDTARASIIVAVIGLVGTIGVAVISYLGGRFNPGSQATNPESGHIELPNSNSPRQPPHRAEANNTKAADATEGLVEEGNDKPQAESEVPGVTPQPLERDPMLLPKLDRQMSNLLEQYYQESPMDESRMVREYTVVDVLQRNRPPPDDTAPIVVNTRLADRVSDCSVAFRLEQETWSAAPVWMYKFHNGDVKRYDQRPSEEDVIEIRNTTWGNVVEPYLPLFTKRKQGKEKLSESAYSTTVDFRLVSVERTSINSFIVKAKRPESIIRDSATQDTYLSSHELDYAFDGSGVELDTVSAIVSLCSQVE